MIVEETKKHEKYRTSHRYDKYLSKYRRLFLSPLELFKIYLTGKHTKA